MSEAKISGQLGCVYCYCAMREITLWLISQDDHLQLNQYRRGTLPESENSPSCCCTILANRSTTKWIWSRKYILKADSCLHMKTSMWWTEEKVYCNLSLLLWPYEDIKPRGGWKLHTRSAAMRCSKSKTAKARNDRLDDAHVHPFELVTLHKLS